MATRRQSLGPKLTPAQRKLRAQIAVQTSWANTTDRRARTAPASEASMKRFEHEVDPDGLLPEKERLLRADAAKRAYFAKLSFLASKARQKAPAGAETAASTSRNKRRTA
jgi:hypothetical protein